VQFQPVDQAEQQRLAQQAQDVQRFREQRQRLDAGDEVVPAGTPTRAPLPGSPIVLKPGVEIGKDRVPPKNYEAPKPDASVEPKPRAAQTPEQPRTQPQPTAAARVAPQPHGNAPAVPPAGAKQDNPKEKDKQ